MKFIVHVKCQNESTSLEVDSTSIKQAANIAAEHYLGWGGYASPTEENNFALIKASRYGDYIVGSLSVVPS